MNVKLFRVSTHVSWRSWFAVKMVAVGLIQCIKWIRPEQRQQGNPLSPSSHNHLHVHESQQTEDRVVMTKFSCMST